MSRSCNWPTKQAGLALLFVSVFIAAQAAAADENRFGFTGPEIFPIDHLISHLRVADINGDQLNDIIVVNNGRSRINLLINETGSTNRADTVSVRTRREINELPPDARFRIESIASEKRIASLAVEDFNSDGRPDIAYYGEPRELVVIYNESGGTWSSPRRWPIEDGQLTPNALGSGDLNGDGRMDLVLLADQHVHLLHQTEDNTLAEPERIPFSGTVKSVQVVDVDGDQKSDLLLVNWDDRNPFRFRLQRADGQLGPEIYFPTAPIRSYWADTLNRTGGTQVITIAQNSGRAQISEFQPKPSEPLSGVFHQGQFQVLPLARTERARRGMRWADINADGRQDLIVAEPENGQLAVYLQGEDGSLGARKRFPTLAGVSDLAVADWEVDGKPELFLLSQDERQVGMTRWDDKERLPFPSLLSLDGRPLVLAVGKLKKDGKPVLAVVVDKDGKRFLNLRRAEGEWQSRPLNEKFRSNPSTLAFHDADQDGLMDLVILAPYEPVKILRQTGDDNFDEVDVAPPGGVLEQPWLSAADVDGDGVPELLLTQKNFVRAAVLKRESRPVAGTDGKEFWTFIVKEQINGWASNSRLAGVAAVPNGTNAVPSLFLLDIERKVLTLCDRDDAGVWQISRNLPLPVQEFNSLEPVTLGSPSNYAVSLLGINTVGLLPLSGDRWELTELDSYESPIRDGRLTDVVSGDLDNDGRKDLVFLETGRNYLDLVIFNEQNKLIPANRWQVFEERTFRGRRSDLPEPREAVVEDVTGDQKNDLVVLVHDRVLVYPQD